MDFTLRPWLMSDLDSLVLHANNFNVARQLRDVFPLPYTREDGEIFFGFATKDAPIHNFAIEINCEAVGAIGIHAMMIYIKKCRAWLLRLAEPFWENGIITNTIKQMVTYAFQNFDINRIFAIPFATNIGSQKALQKAGFLFILVCLINSDW
jgi:[ribosomal protein S5]-alanine N-acetyltransferase